MVTAAEDILALFDLDGTLLTGDCDEAWVEFLIDRGALDRASFEHANAAIVERYRRGEVGLLEFTEQPSFAVGGECPVPRRRRKVNDEQSRPSGH